jgi:hypothetical protein
MLDQAAPRREQAGLFHTDLLTPKTDPGQGGSASPKVIGNGEAQSNSQRVEDSVFHLFLKDFREAPVFPS